MLVKTLKYFVQAYNKENMSNSNFVFKKPLSPGDLAIIINSALGLSVGKVVQCVSIVGTHSEYGTVWNVGSREPLMTEYGGHGNNVHIPAIWLRRVEPGELDKSKVKTLERVE